jgi:tight adherence protein B
VSVVAGLAVAGAVLAVASTVAGAARLDADRRVRRRLLGAPPARALASGSPRLDPTGLVARLRRSSPVHVLRRHGRADRRLPLLLDQVTRHLRAGSSLPAALRAAADAADDDTDRLAADLAAGRSLAEAVEDWRRRCATPARDLAAAALTLAAEAGGAVAVVLDGVNETLRDRVALEREVAALSSQARASAAVLVVAPIVFAVLAAVADPRVAEVLVGSPVGWACLATGLLLDALGALWMARLVTRVR